MTAIGYIYTLPTTANVSFQELVVPNAQYQRPISDATASRGRLRAALKEHKQSDLHDYLNIQKAIEDYIPLMFGLVAGIDSSELRLMHEVETTWRCVLSNIALSSKQPRVKQKSIHYEAIFTILTLGYVLMDRANEYSQAVHKKILVAIGDVSNYIGGYGDVSSISGGGTHHSTGSGGNSGSGSGFSAAAAAAAGVLSSGSGSSSGASRLFKKSSSSTSSKSAKNQNTIGEFTDYLSDEDLAGIDHQLTTAADLYCKAAGVFEYIVQNMVPRWNKSMAAAVMLSQDANAASGSNSKTADAANVKALSESSRPVDVQTSVISAHIKIALAEAHACAVRKASIKAARASAVKLASSGGLSTSVKTGSGATSKTSYVLLAKLTIGIKEEYERAYGLLKSVKDLNEISTEFRVHVKDAKVYYEAAAQTFLGLDAYESQQYGKAIGFMTIARASFASLSKSSKAHVIANAAGFEYRLSNEKIQSFQKINDAVTFEQVPSQNQLLAVMPSGRDLLASKKYVPPKPSFGTAATATEENSTEDGVKNLTYAMQGSYF